MINKFIRVEELQFLVDQLDQHACVCEFLRKVRPTALDKVSPDNLRSIFKVSEVLRVAYEVARKRGVEEPFKGFLQPSSFKELEEK
jgi:hypothetical protein